MDRSAPEIVFTDTGCNFCDRATEDYQLTIMPFHTLDVPHFNPRDLEQPENEYDVLIGLSGGVDSASALLWCIRQGLRPLCFSVDNGWNSEVADENIMKLVEGFKVPFIRYAIDTNRFEDLQAAFMAAGVKNIEIPTDHVLMAVSYELADKYGIKTILSGGNVATESIMPPSWGYNARDLVHIKDVYKKVTGKRLSGLPMCGLLKWNWYKWVKGIKIVYPLDTLYYKRDQAIETLWNLHKFENPGEKHCESVFTWWFQNFYLFEKFGIDKRKAHLSSLIVSGQMTREEALEKINENPVYPQLGIEKKVLEYPVRSHYDFKTDEKLFNFIGGIIKALR